MIGLNISSVLNSVVTIYITIPLILVPQILFSGTVVDFDKIHKDFTSDKYVPVIGDMMTSRWAYEALMVTQFTRNKYERYYFENEKNNKQANYISTTLCDKLSSKLTFCLDSIDNETSKDEVVKDLKTITNELNKLKADYGKKFWNIDKLNYDNFDEKVKTQTYWYIDSLRKHYRKIDNKCFANNDKIREKLLKKYKTDEKISELRKKYHNERLKDIVTKTNELNPIVEANYEIIQKTNPIFKKPESNIGRAHFFSATKKLFGNEIPTLWFNVAFIWFTSLTLYIILIFDLVNRLSKMFKKIKALFKKKK